MKKFNTATLKQHVSMILDAINDERVTDDNLKELHNEVFNTDYFIIGYYNAEKWIIENFDSVFSAIEIVREYEVDNFGEMTTKINAESIANMLSYICGELVLSEIDAYDIETVNELKETCEVYFKEL